jgi:hypothetical protein
MNLKFDNVVLLYFRRAIKRDFKNIVCGEDDSMMQNRIVQHTTNTTPPIRLKFCFISFFITHHYKHQTRF